MPRTQIILGCDIVYSDILNDVFKYGETHGRKPESLCYTQAKQLKKFYEDTNQTEKAYNCPEFITNSFHLHVSEQVSPFEKQDEEFDLFHMIEGGHICYCRIDDPTNVEGMKQVVERGMKMGMYQGVNFESSNCCDCGAHSVVAPNSISTCPICGSHNVVTMSRVCGYLGYSYVNGSTRFNEGKLAELHSRVSM